MMKDIEKIRKDRNFRELGGYETTDGKHVKKGMFYRCGALADLNEEELAIVRSLGIKTILDLRSDYENVGQIVKIISLIKDATYDLFYCNIIATKAVPEATERLQALSIYHRRGWNTSILQKYM